MSAWLEHEEKRLRRLHFWHYGWGRWLRWGAYALAVVTAFYFWGFVSNGG